MNAHAAIDRAIIPVTRLVLGGYRLFSESLDSAEIEEHLERVRVDVPAPPWQGVIEVPARTLRGELDPAFVVSQWLGVEYPTIIYHHGNNERPFDFGPLSKNSFKNVLLAKRATVRANLIALRAPYHRSFKTYMREMAHLANFTAMIATSCRLIESLVVRIGDAGGGPVIVSGFSLGGWVTNVHRAYYDSATTYVPMAAGAALDDTVIDSAWAGTVHHAVQRAQDDVRRVLNFERAFAAVAADDVFPLLGRHDQYVRYAVQKRSYGARHVATLDKGHVTLLASAGELRAHLLAALPAGQVAAAVAR